MPPKGYKIQKTFEQLVRMKRIQARLGLRRFSRRIGAGPGNLFTLEDGRLKWRGLRVVFAIQDELGISDKDLVASLRKSVELVGKGVDRRRRSRKVRQ